MKLKLFLIFAFSLITFSTFSQESKLKKFKKLSCPEKWWVLWHPFVANKALKTTEESRFYTMKTIKEGKLFGNGNGLQVDAFRHTYWMARLTQEIGWRKALKLGNAHEKGNYKDYKKRKLEDGVIPDKISSEMDFFNNKVGVDIGKKSAKLNLEIIIIKAVLQGRCKIMKIDSKGNYLTCDEEIIPEKTLKGLWENNKCLVNSNVIP